jgi:hypothetical protein
MAAGERAFEVGKLVGVRPASGFLIGWSLDGSQGHIAPCLA